MARGLRSSCLPLFIASLVGIWRHASAASARKSVGCGKALTSSTAKGKSEAKAGTFDGVERSWRVFVPSSYDPKKPVPLVLSIHGWGGDGLEDERDGGLGLMAEKHGFVALFPDGLDDNDSWGGPWNGWNVVGSTLSPGPEGPTCAGWADSPTYCYESCWKAGRCNDKPQCQWTSCVADVTPTGIGTKATGFLPQLLDMAEKEFCIDVTREYVTGQSNGGMATYQVGVSMAQRVAAIAPVAGSFHTGFGQVPKVPLPVMDIHGDRDRTVPGNDTTSNNGWYYIKTGEILKGFAASNGCKDIATARPVYPTGQHGVKGLSCVAHGRGKGCVPAVACSYSGVHTYFANDAPKNGMLVWEFLSRFSRPTHLGLGESAHGTPPATEVAPLQPAGGEETREASDASPAAPAAVAAAVAAAAPAPAAFPGRRHRHYGDPAAGCHADEEALDLSDGKTSGGICAPKIKVKHRSNSSNVAGEEPQCLVGGRFPRMDNGCPKDAPLPAGSEAWPVCLRFHPEEKVSSFHCLLVCGPCRDDPLRRPNTCSDQAHGSCPSGARCVLGHLRAMNQGVCAYTSHDDNATAGAVDGTKVEESQAVQFV